MGDYTGLAAFAWDLFSGNEPGPDVQFFLDILEQRLGTALDVGCGTGRLLIPYLKAGHAVEGVEPSADMLTILRRKADALGLAPVLYQQSMQMLKLPRTYRTIFVPCGSFQLVVDRSEAFEALRHFHAHLEPKGALVLTAYNRWQELENERLGEWTFRARASLPDGTELEKHARVESQRLIEQTLKVTVRYRRVREGQVVEEQHVSAPERWYFQHELTLMLEKTGFRDINVFGNYTDKVPTDDDFVLIFVGTK